jgi:DNA-binding response OmpR family regulator
MAGRRVLVVEDELLIADMIEDSLALAGFEVSLARDGSEAIERIEASAARYDALVTDISLGSGPNGWKVAHLARQHFPSIAVLYLAADRAREWVSVGVPNSLALAKPISPAYVVKTISFLLNTGHIGRAA